MSKRENEVMSLVGSTRIKVAWAGAVMLITALVFMASVDFNFISYDDPLYIVENDHVNTGLSLSNLKWAFVSAGDTNLWQPLTFISHQLDVELFGLNAKWHHAVNVLWHALAAGLLFLVASRLTGSNLLGFFCAAIWAVHPEKIQSVAWLSERKDLLSGALFLASILSFMHWRQKSKPSLYLISLLCFVAAAMSKPSVVALPLVLFVLFYAERRIVTAAVKSLPALSPFMLVSLAVAVATLYFQSKGGLADVGQQQGLLDKLVKIPVSYAFYMVRFVWPNPSQLWFYSPESIRESIVVLGLLALLVPLLIWFGLKERLIALGLALYTALWLPVSGLVTIGFYFVADRYSYLPMIGLVLMAVGLVKFFTRAQRDALLATAVLSFVLAGFVFLQQQQLPLWKNDASLFSHEMKVNPRSMLAPYYYGKLFEEDEPEKALRYYQKAHEIDSQAGLPLLQMGIVQLKMGRNREALDCFNLGTQVSSPVAENWNRLLMLQAELELHAEADVSIQQGLQQFPDELRYIINCANYYLVNRNQPEKGLPLYLKALELDPNNKHCITGAALCFQKLGDPEKAQKLIDRLKGKKKKASKAR